MLTHETLEAEADAVIDSYEPEYVPRVRVDWGGNGNYDHELSDLSMFVDKLTTDRALSGSAPEELLLIEGASAAELTIELSGEYDGLSLTTIFSPFNPASPFYSDQTVGSEITLEIGVVTAAGIAYYPQFVGQVRTIEPDRGSNTVIITALDRVELLRRPVMLPPWALSEQHVSYGEEESQWIHSHWVIDHCLRWCNTSPTPYRPNYRSETGLPPDSVEGPQFFLTGNGSYVPTLGWVDNLNASAFPVGDESDPMYSVNGVRHPDAPADAPIPMAFAAQGETAMSTLPLTPDSKGVTRYWCADRETIGATHYAGFTLHGLEHQSIAQHNTMEIRTGGGLELRVQISTGSIRGQIYNHNTSSIAFQSTWITIPLTGHVDCFVQWDNSPATGGRMFVQAGANSTGGMTSFGSYIAPGDYDQIQGRVSVAQAVSLSDVFYASRNYQNSTPNRDEAMRPAKYAASLDHGLNRFSYLPTRQDDAWNIMTETAAAELGSVFWDESGRFHFWNYEHILELHDNPPVRDIPIDDVTGLKVVNNLDSVRNVYSAKLNRKRSKGIVRCYESQDEWEFYVPAQTAKKFRIWSDDVVSPLTFKMNKYTDSSSPTWPTWGDDVNHGFCVQYRNPATGVWARDDTKATVDVYVYYTAQGYLTVKMWNGNTWDVRFADVNGNPALRIAGTKVFDSGEVPLMVQDQSSVNNYNYHNYELSGDWYQDALSQFDLLSWLLNRTVEPSPSTDAISVVGDIRIQLGDCVRVLDPDGMGNLTLQIYGINRSWSVDDGLIDTYTVEIIKPPGVGYWDNPDYGIWDSSFIWS